MEIIKSKEEAMGASVPSSSSQRSALPIRIYELLFGEKLSSKNKFLSTDVFKKLELLDHMLVLSLKKIIDLILKWKNFLPTTNKEKERLKVEISRGLDMIDILRDDYVWEHLNVGHWKSVSPMWRKTYTFLSLLKAILLLQKGEPYEEVIRQCDLGLLMGEPVLSNILSSLAEELSLLIRQDRFAQHVSEKTDFKHEDSTHENIRLMNQWDESMFEISYDKNPSLESFSVYMKNEEPVIITGSIEHWPAFQKWNVQFIKEVAGFRTVPVEIGPKYTSEEWTQTLMRIDEFIERYMKPENPHLIDKYDVGYIAQHHLFDQIPELKKDIKIPEYCTLGNSPDIEVNAWFGPANTVSPTHYDPKHNLLVQIFGTKIIRLYPPSESEFLRPYPATSLLFNTSQIDIECHDLLITHPEIKNARYCEFILTSGMILYIPPKWWHYVKSLTPCFSASFWFN